MTSIYDELKELPIPCRSLLNIIQKNGPVTFSSLMDALKIGRSKLQSMMSQLLKSRIICECGYSESTGGRRSILYDVNCSDFFLIGISVGSARYGVCISNLKNQCLVASEFQMNSQIRPREFVAQVHQEVEKMAAQCGLDAGQFLGVGLNISGAVDCEQGVLVRQEALAFHPDWSGAPLQQILEQEFHLHAAVDVYVSMQTLEQYYYGCGKNSARLLVVTCGMGIGAGFLDRGHVVRSINNTGNSFAHLTIDFDGRKCMCGNYGCLDCYASARAIIQQITQKIKTGIDSCLSKDVDSLSISKIICAAKQGDLLAASELNYAALTLGIGLANYIRLVAPDTVILMGLIVSQFPEYGERAIQTAKKRLYRENLSKEDLSFIQLNEWKRTGTDGTAMFIERLLNPEEETILKIEHRT